MTMKTPRRSTSLVERPSLLGRGELCPPIENDPRRTCKALEGVLAGLWRYRVGAFRLFCAIDDRNGIVRVTRMARRDAIYKSRQ
jgi:mRNA-degrading endonuclease RelE of RelBE toxin-antitoxin system